MKWNALCSGLALVLLMWIAPAAEAAEPVELGWVDGVVSFVWEPVRELAAELLETISWAAELEAVEGEAEETFSSDGEPDPDDDSGPQEILGHVEPIG